MPRLQIAETQQSLPVDFVIPQNEYLGNTVPESSRLKFNTLIRINGDGLPISADEPNDEIKSAASIQSIEGGLYIPVNDPRYNDAESIITVHPKALRFEKRALTGHHGVIFPPDEFKVVARSPHDLALSVRNSTRGAGRETEAVRRSAGHALGRMIIGLERLESRVEIERSEVRSLLNDLSTRAPHFKSRNLERVRHTRETKIHDTVDVAAINLNLGNVTIGAIHDEVRRRMYKQSHKNRVESWKGYLFMSGRYATNRIDRIKHSKQRTQKEYRKYKPALDKKYT